jgi:hypothetical protein
MQVEEFARNALAPVLPFADPAMNDIGPELPIRRHENVFEMYQWQTRCVKKGMMTR